MLIYIFLLCIVVLFGRMYDKSTQSSKYSWLYLMGIVLSVSYISGVRDIGVGTDTRIYTVEYFQAGATMTKKELLENPDNLDRGYLLLNYIASLFGKESWLGLFFTHFFIWSVLLIAAVKLKKYRYSVALFLFIYFTIFYNRSLNYMRQSCAMSVVLLAYCYYLQKEWKKALALLMAAVVFHSSAIISLLIPFFDFIVHIKSTRLKALIIFGTSIAMMLMIKLFNWLLQFGFTYGLFKDVYLDRYGGSTTSYRAGGFGKETLWLFVLELLIIIYSWRKRYIDNKLVQFLLLLHITYISMYSLTKVSEYLYRNSYYFYLIDLFYMAYLLSKWKSKNFLYWIFCLSLIICWYTYFVDGNACQTYPYTSTILNIK